MLVARWIVDDHYHHEGTLTLRHWRGGFYRWSGPAWAEVDDKTVRSTLYHSLENATYLDGKVTKEWAPTARKISDVNDALIAVTLADADPPAWIDGPQPPINAAELVAVSNGLLHLPTRHLHEHTPRYFNLVNCPLLAAAMFGGRIEQPGRFSCSHPVQVGHAGAQTRQPGGPVPGLIPVRHSRSLHDATLEQRKGIRRNPGWPTVASRHLTGVVTERSH